VKLVRQIGMPLEQGLPDGRAVGRRQYRPLLAHVEELAVERVGGGEEPQLGADVRRVVTEDRTLTEASHVRHAIAHEVVDGVRGLQRVLLQPPADQPLRVADRAVVDQDPHQQQWQRGRRQEGKQESRAKPHGRHPGMNA
jgi:hypothetical protein